MESPYIGYLLLCFLLAAIAIVIEVRARRRDREPMEYLSAWSDARRVQRDVPIMLRKQAD